MKKFLKRIFIEESTLGLLKGYGNENISLSLTDNEKQFNEFSIFKRILGYIVVSILRYVSFFIFVILPFVLILALIYSISFWSNIDAEKNQQFIIDWYNYSGYELAWWMVFLMMFIGWSIVYSFIYIFIRSIVNIVSLIYFCFYEKNSLDISK